MEMGRQMTGSVLAIEEFVRGWEYNKEIYMMVE